MQEIGPVPSVYKYIELPLDNKLGKTKAALVLCEIVALDNILWSDTPCPGGTT